MRVRWFAIAAVVGLWVVTIALSYWKTGLFQFIGDDFSIFYSQSRVLASGHFDQLYDTAAAEAIHQTLRSYADGPGVPIWLVPAPIARLIPPTVYEKPTNLIFRGGPVPYPPLFACLLLPFTLPAPPVGFALWTIVNAVAGFFLARRMALLFPPSQRLFVVVVALTSFPFVYALILGQPVLLLGVAVAEFYFCLREERDFRGGLWLSVLFFKPQYGILIAPWLVWKRRWSAVAGATLGCVAILAAGMVATGVTPLLTYVQAIVADGDFNGQSRLNGANMMVNWRGIVLNLAPNAPIQDGLLLVGLASILTVVILVPIMRGKWAPRASSFPYQFVALLVATVLATYHSHSHGLVLLAVPLAAILTDPDLSATTRAILRIGIIVPTALFLISHSLQMVGVSYGVLLVALYADLAWRLAWTHDRTALNWLAQSE